MSLPAQALIVQGYTPQRHDRFYVGVDKAFMGDGYDFSGAGIADNGRFATLVSPSYFVSATHSHAGNGSTVTFFHTNDPAGSSDQRTIVSGQKIDGTDIWLGKLSAPVSSNVTPYAIPILDQSSDYLGQEIVATGISNTAFPNVRVGRNVTLSFSNLTLGSSTGNTIRTFNNGASGFNPDESQVQGGDSGAPVFMTLDGQLSLLGTHWATSGTSMTWDTFIPDYFDSIQAIVQADGESLTTIPEPTAAMLVSAMAIGLLRRRRAA